MTPSSAVRAPPGLYLDTAQICSSAVIQAAKAAGYLGIERYVPLPRNSTANDITEAELDRILGAELLSLPIQHVRLPGWNPIDHDGEEDARIACAYAQMVGYPAGIHLLLDLEGINGSGLSTMTFAIGWQKVVREEGFKAALYVGYSVPLHPIDLYMLPGFDQYATDAGNRQVATRGTSMKQKAGIVIYGTKFDPDEIAPDLLGDVPYFASAIATDVA